MPDITMCHGDTCKDRATCYRATATPTPGRQSWFPEPAGSKEECVYYWRDPKQEAVAQRIEQRPSKSSVAGSSPARFATNNEEVSP